MALFLDSTKNGQPTRIVPHNGHHFQLQELQQLVGGYIEVVRAPTVCDVDLYMVLNEDGKRESLPINGYATSLFHQAGGPVWDSIVGNVVLCTLEELNEPTDDDELADQDHHDDDHDAVDPNDQ